MASRDEAKAGAVAFASRGCPDLGEFDGPVFLKTCGTVPDDFAGAGT